MAVTSLDILNLSHSLKDICEVNCNTPECLSQTLKLLLQYNLIQVNLQFGRQLAQAEAAESCPPRRGTSAGCPSHPGPSAGCPSHPGPSAGSSPHPGPSPEVSADCPPPVRLDIGDPFLADYEK